MIDHLGTVPAYASSQHLDLLGAKRDRLTAAICDAEAQWFTQVNRLVTSGREGLGLLELALQKARKRAVPGWTQRWGDAGLPSPQEVTRWRRDLESWPPDADYWIGDNPLPPGVGYPRGFVVYLLFDAAGTVVYVGSTGSIRNRFQAHRRDGKKWTRWQAYPCDDRQQARDLETRLLAGHLPPLNRRRSA